MASPYVSLTLRTSSLNESGCFGVFDLLTAFNAPRRVEYAVAAIIPSSDSSEANSASVSNAISAALRKSDDVVAGHFSTPRALHKS